MDSKAVAAFLALLLVSATLTEGASMARVGSELRCQCVSTHSTFIPFKFFESVRLIRSGPHCKNIEVIAVLKNGRQVCLEPTAGWVKAIIKHFLDKAETNSETES
ncbi:interleukin-8-like [Python bivittatus]|uniref:Interleukin-8-like n=1 Tax=Python bivittatus TaxID=176946 RepID=A0A9F2WAT2_PYTBI|nr:interleukin-8-like [Python bivittatus]